MKKTILSLLAVVCLTACGGSKEAKPSGKEVSKEEFKEKVSDVKYAKENLVIHGVKLTGSFSYEYKYDESHSDLDEKLEASGWIQYNYSSMEGFTYSKDELSVTHTKGGNEDTNQQHKETVRSMFAGYVMNTYDIHCLYNYLNIQDAYMSKLFEAFTFYVNPTQIGYGFKDAGSSYYKSINTFNKEGVLVEVVEQSEKTERISIERTNDTTYQYSINYNVKIEYL